MTRPQVIVNVEAAIRRRGAPTDTGVAFMVYAGATGSTDPVECYSKADALAASAPEAIAGYVGDALTQGAPKVWLLRAEAVDAEAVTEAEWTTALDKLGSDFGPGQVLIPGDSSAGAHAALLAHAAEKFRCALLDHAVGADASSIATTAAGLASAEGAYLATLCGSWVEMPGTVGVSRQVPGSVIVAGLAARGDATAGHANNAPAGTHSGGAGVVRGAIGLVTSFTDAEHDTLHDAGVSCFRSRLGVPQLYGWRSLSTDDRFLQLNWGRLTMQIRWGIEALAEQFLFRQIDGKGRLYAEFHGALAGYLAPMEEGDALVAFDVEVAGVNTPTTAAAGELHAAVEVQLSAHVEKVIVDVMTSVTANEGIAA